ncbi:MAG: hypothetical protein HDS61_05165 [Barnesiella sp.]|nr:hypothetical protein [Barnesiella sp.]
MIRINRYDIQTIAEEYFNHLDNWRKKLKLASPLFPFAGISYRTLRELILCEPAKLANCQNHTGIDAEKFPEAYKAFFYSYFVDNTKTVNIAQWLSKRLKIRVCPYCNRTYTFTVKKRRRNGKVVRIKPEMDHFFPKGNANYKHLALSFYNLVPSCPTCNHVKKDKQIDYHPYVGHLDGKEDPYFEVTVKSSTSDGCIFPNNPVVKIQNSNKNVDTLVLDELYKCHSDYVKELLDKIQAYNHSLYEPLINSFQTTGNTQEQIDKLIWGTPIDDSQFDKRPLSKLTYDILRQFKVLD